MISFTMNTYMFSTIALENILKKYKLEIFKIDKLNIHGGSNRYFIKKTNQRRIHKSVITHRKSGLNYGLNNIQHIRNLHRASKIKLK